MIQNRTINEGVRAGLLGAATVAIWFFIAAGSPIPSQ
jgi:hypothetical protein